MPPSLIIETPSPGPQAPPPKEKHGSPKERIAVCVRLRPINRNEVAEGDKAVWTVKNDVLEYTGPMDASIRQRNLPTSYSYDHVYDVASPSYAVYEQSCKQLVLGSMQGLNSTIFAYGPTGSGKTYTMRAIMEMAAQEIFAYILENPDREFTLRISALEIYNESVRDLLRDKGEAVNCYDHPDRGMIIEGLSDEGVESAKHLLQIIRAVERRRHVRDTRLNESSSRSHQIVRLHIESSPRIGSPDVPDLEDITLSTELDLTRMASTSQASPSDRGTMIAQLNFVDLAGSERTKAAGLEDQFDSLRMKEGSHINQSLLTLGKVIRKLGEKDKGVHVPFRESKLTRLLQPSLGGNSKTAIVCCISPALGSIENTRATLHFASAAKKVVTAPRVNKVLDDKTIIKQLHEEIASLRRQLALVDTEQLSARLQAIQNQARMTAEERDAATKRLRNLEKLILRAPPGAVKRRASWSPGVKSTPPVDLELSSEDELSWSCEEDGEDGWGDQGEEDVAGGSVRRQRTRGRGGRAAQSLRSSWNPGAYSSRKLKTRDDQATVATPRTGRERRYRYGDPLFIDLFLTPKVTHKVKSLYASSDSSRNSPRVQFTKAVRTAALQAHPTTSTELAFRLKDMADKPVQGKTEREAIEALRAEVRAIKHGSGALFMEGEEDNTELTIACLKQELQRMEHEAVIGEFLDQTKEDTIRFLRSELERLLGTVEAKAAADDAVASLEERVRNLPLQLDIDGIYEAGIAALSSLPSPLEKNGSTPSRISSKGSGFGFSFPDFELPEELRSQAAPTPTGEPEREGADKENHVHSHPLGSSFMNASSGKSLTVATDFDGQGAPLPSPLGNVSSKATTPNKSRRTTLTIDVEMDKENEAAMGGGVPSSRGQHRRSRTALGTSMENLSIQALRKLSSKKDLVNQLTAISDRALLQKGPSGDGRLVNQQVAAAWQAAQEWYRNELQRVQQGFQEETEQDLESIKACLTEYSEGVSRLNCQKKFLLNRVLLLEYSLKEAQAVESALQNELDDTKSQLTEANMKVQEALARVKKAEAAAVYATPRGLHASNSSRSPHDPTARSGQGLPGTPLGASTPQLQLGGLTVMSEGLDDEYWADEPSEENLLPRILRLWDELHVPLRHRSRFLLAFRGKETFYFEAEERRLMWLKSKMQGPTLTHAEKMRQLGAARATLERERKRLAKLMKQKVPEHTRMQMFEAWGIPVDSKARKLQLTYKLWSSESLGSRELLTKASELIVKLYGDSLVQNPEELVFFGSNLRTAMTTAVKVA